MARSTLHTADEFLDAAVGLFASGGARAVTMAAVARAKSAPSGSIYHRFESRGALLAAVWQRTALEFEAEYKSALGAVPSPDAAVRAAVWMVDWCRTQPGRAAVLHAGPGAFEPATWPKDALLQHRSARQDLSQDIAALIQLVAESAGVPQDEAAFAMFGLPMAVAGDHLRRGDPVPAGASDLVGRLSRRVLRLDQPT